MKTLVQVSLLVLLSAFWQPLMPAKEWSFADSIGLAVLNSGKTCLSIDNASLAANSRIRLVITSRPQRESDAEVSKVEMSCPDRDTGMQRYEVRGDTTKLTPSMPVIAIVGFSGNFRGRGGLITADLDGDGRDEYFRSCTSTDGIHFTVWSGKPLVGKLTWHKYYYLGYDVSPTCTEKETEPPK